MKRVFLLSIVVAAISINATADAQKIVDDLIKRTQSGDTTSILFWSPEQRRVGFREITQIQPTREIHRGTNIYEFKENRQDLSLIEYTVEGTTKTVQDFLDQPESIGLIVVHRNQIIFEQYQAGNTKESRWISFSVTKSVTSMLIGAAIKDGYIKSVDEPVVNYLPRLRGTAYEAASIKDVLQMSSGVAWNEDYADPDSDVAHAGGLNGLPLVQYLSKLDVDQKPGEKFNYNTGETNLVGQILRAAIGNNASTYLTKKIWQPFGMEFNASWSLDSPFGAELGGCCINATLRDYARLGIFAMKNGKLPNGEEVLPANWMKDSTTPSKGFPGYGYLWWLAGDGSYAAQGIFGQNISIDPETELVIAMHNSAPAAVGTKFHQERNAVLAAIRAHFQ